MADTDQTNEQASSGLEGTTGTALEGEGASAATGQTTGNGPGTTAEESFFDPSSIKGTPLETAYKQMQGQWTKSMQQVKASKTKIDAYEQFERDPHGTMQQLAKAYGYQLLQGQQEKANENWEPKTWDDVFTRAKSEAKAEVMKEFEPILKPVFDEVKNLRKANIEKSLEEIDPQWKLYETDMMDSLKAHPTLVSDPEKLYRMSVPKAVIEAKAMKDALVRLQSKQSSAQVSGGSSTTAKPSQVPRASNFQEAVAIAEKQVIAQGFRKPGHA